MSLSKMETPVLDATADMKAHHGDVTAKGTAPPPAGDSDVQPAAGAPRTAGAPLGDGMRRRRADAAADDNDDADDPELLKQQPEIVRDPANCTTPAGERSHSPSATAFRFGNPYTSVTDTMCSTTTLSMSSDLPLMCKTADEDSDRHIDNSHTAPDLQWGDKHYARHVVHWVIHLPCGLQSI